MLRYKQALQYFASKLGVTAQEVQDRLNNFVATYPGPDCLEPHEVELAYEGRLPLYRLEHTHQCDDCQALLELESSKDSEGDEMVPDAEEWFDTGVDAALHGSAPFPARLKVGGKASDLAK